MANFSDLEKVVPQFRKHTPLREVRFILAVGSGKGGVGKTTLSLLLSLTLREEGFSVGLFDLDFYGPNVLLLLGAPRRDILLDAYGYKPVEVCGIKVMSLSLLVSDKEPIFMRGLMAGKLLQELSQRVLWGPLDFLVLDLPPGTGDIFLNMIELFQPDGFLLVTTPHKLSIADTMRTLSILKERKVPLLGVVKNMGGLFKKEEALDEFLKETRLPVTCEIPFMSELSEMESLEEFLQLDKYKELREKLAKAVLKKIFRFH